MGSNWHPSIELVLLVVTQLGWIAAFLLWRTAIRRKDKFRDQKFSKQEASLQLSIKESEELIWQRTKDLKAIKRQLKTEIQNRIQAESDREKLTRKLYLASKQAELSQEAGNAMYQLANVTNSIGIISESILQNAKDTGLERLEKAVQLISRTPQELSNYLREDSRGQRLPEYFQQALYHLREQHGHINQGVQALRKHAIAASETIARQQSAGRTAGVSNEFSVSAVCDEAIKISQVDMAEQGLAIVRDYQPLPPIRADKRSIIQIVTNLLCNAQQSLALSEIDRPEIQISTWLCDAGLLNISVRDNGPGIKKENRSQIFKRGFTTRKQCNGIGLHASLLAAQELDGMLELKDEDGQTGAHFLLTVPATTLVNEPKIGQPTASNSIVNLLDGINHCVTMPFVEV